MFWFEHRVPALESGSRQRAPCAFQGRSGLKDVLVTESPPDELNPDRQARSARAERNRRRRRPGKVEREGGTQRSTRWIPLTVNLDLGHAVRRRRDRDGLAEEHVSPLEERVQVAN